MSISQPIASTSSGADAFDAIVQAANPSHPNHAAWVEKYGGSLSRKATKKLSDEDEGEDHLEKFSQNSQRRRPSNGGSRNSVHSRSSPAKERASNEAVGKYPSRESSIRISLHSSSRPPLPVFTAGSRAAECPSAVMTEEAIPRRRKKKRRDKGKEKGEAPPVPPPRTTSQALPSPSSPSVPLYSGHASTSTLSNTQATASNRHTISSMGSPLTPSTSLPLTHSSSLNSRNNSISLQGSLDQASSSKDSKLRGREPLRSRHQIASNDPPARLSSMLSRVGNADAGQLSDKNFSTYRPDFSPTQSLNGHTISRRSSRKSVDFALPEEPQRKGSFDLYSIRKSFDTFVSPFKEGKRQTSVISTGFSPKTIENGRFTAVPILKSSLQSVSHTGFAGSYSGHVARPLSCVQDEGDVLVATSENEISPSPAEPHQQPSEEEEKEEKLAVSAPTKAAEVPTHPFTMISSPGMRSESLTEEGDDFFDAESDEGGNGSSADDRSRSKKATDTSRSQGGHNTPTSGRRRVGIKKSGDDFSMPKSKAKPTYSGLGVEDSPIANPLANEVHAIRSREKRKSDSSASEAEAMERHLSQKSKEYSKADHLIKSRSHSLSKRRSAAPLPIEPPVNAGADPQAVLVTFPSKSDHLTPAAGRSQHSQKEKKVVQSRKGLEEEKHLPIRGINQAIPDRSYKDDEMNRKYPFETSPSAYYFPTSIGARSTSSWNNAQVVPSKSSEKASIISASQSMTGAKDKTRDPNGTKTVGKSSKGTFAGVMARMRRDRSNTTASQPMVKADVPQQFSHDSLAAIEKHPLEEDHANATSAPLGLGIATSDVTASPPLVNIVTQSSTKSGSKGWRTRLISFSQKGAKSPKPNAEESFPPMPSQSAAPPVPTTPLLKSPARPTDAGKQPDHAPQATTEVAGDRYISKASSSVAPLQALNNAASRNINESYPSNSHAKMKMDLQQVSPTIHKSLSPALLTQQKYEADEVASFVGSERDKDSKRETWSSTNHLEMAPLRKVGIFRNDKYTTVESALKEPEEQEESSLASPASVGLRHLANAADLTEKVSPQAANSSICNSPQSFPLPPIRTSPLPREHGCYVGPELQNRRPSQPSPAPRRSLDVKMYRSGSIPLSVNGTNDRIAAEAHFRGHSITLDRGEFFSQPRSPKTPLVPSILGAGSAKMSKRFFSGGNRAKIKSKGISSDNFHLSEGKTTSSLEGLGRMPYSKSEVCLVNYSRNHEDKLYRGAEDLFADDTLVPPSNSHSQMDSGSINSNSNGYTSLATPMTPKHRLANEEEMSAFDRMLRESAKQDAARLRQITAQARAQQSPI